MKFIKSTQKRYNDQAVIEANNADFYIRLFASSIITISGFMLLTDKVITIDFSNTFGFADSQTFIWILCQSLSPIILCVGGMLKPYKVCYIVPLYLYFIQIFWVFEPSYKMDDFLLHAYAIGFCICIFLFVAFTIFIFKIVKQKRIHQLENIRKITSFILIDIRNKYISPKKRKEFAKDVINLNDTLK